MSNGPRYTVEEVIAAVQECKGITDCVRKRLGCNYQTVMKYRKRHATIEQAFKDEREKMVDLAENGLHHHLDSEQPWAIKFTLHTVGKNRGYVERQEVTGADGGAIVVRTGGNVNTDEL